ncbi:hypothetical protein GJ744_008062 [Endocarpon pusillum]|uniref:Stress-response A/B barrel domain-containing protein n=1 Tax=Endocarpon pusillum TaxID=364733 RepID=A0A8H7AJL1_9EURO|nr:hypothetical protein GJ744_008062 [Endocarpon pusillum]
MSNIVHVVLFQFKPEVSPETVLDVCKQMLSLKERCVSATTNKPYVKSIVGGLDNSPEGNQAGITHGFVVEFESAEDRDYYVLEDPTHIAFTKFAGEVLANAIVVDFNPGSFGTTKI